MVERPVIFHFPSKEATAYEAQVGRVWVFWPLPRFWKAGCRPFLHIVGPTHEVLPTDRRWQWPERPR
jgi:hypothetical protein